MSIEFDSDGVASVCVEEKGTLWFISSVNCSSMQYKFKQKIHNLVVLWLYFFFSPMFKETWVSEFKV